MQNPLSRQGQHTIMNARTKKHVEPDGSKIMVGKSYHHEYLCQETY
ncbi:MAG: hypothetical protein PHF97_07010 [Bacteroidales bacterium]|nr:hypothetical protein [Bacteroidales bacterium]